MAVSSAPKPNPTNSEPAPRSSTTSKASQTSVQQTSKPGSTVTSVTVVPGTSSGERTSTITTHPTSTLSKPVFSTITNSNGSKSVTTPSLVTFWTTSTDSNGTIVTATAVAANAPQPSASGILHNTGAVAGIFTAVGIVFTALIVGMVIYIRRRRRARKHERWLAEMQAQHPSSDPFRDEIPTIHTNVEDGDWNQKDSLSPATSPGHQNFGQTNTSVFPVFPMLRDGAFSQLIKPRLHSTDTESLTKSKKLRHSWAPSTPSIYPASLSPEDEKVSKDIIIISNLNPAVATSPPRPPRSHLRGQGIRALGSVLPTPPESEYSNPTSIVSDPRSHDIHVLDRETILDVQSRVITP